jgi:predicted Zn-dependent protease
VPCFALPRFGAIAFVVMCLPGAGSAGAASSAHQVQQSGSTVSPALKPDACDATVYECATADIGRGEYQAAIASLQQLLARTPRDLKALNLLGIALTGAGRVSEANARFRDALATDPSFYPARKNLAVNEFNAGRLGEARRHFDQVLARMPADEIAHLHLAEIDYAKGHHAEALTHYERSGANPLSNPLWTLHYGTCLLEGGQTARAATMFGQLPTGDYDGRFTAGVTLGQAGAHAEAAQLFASARAGYRDPYAAGYNQALMLTQAHDYDAAIAVAQEMIAQGEARAELYNLASRAYAGANRIQEAYDALREAARREPTAETHYTDLASLCLDHENYDLGLEILDIGLRYRPDSGALHLQRGVVLAMKGQMEQAEREFETTRQLMPASTVPYVALAMTWMQTGRTDRAVDVLRERTRADPSNAALQHLLGVALIRSGVDPAAPAADEAVRAFQAALRSDSQLAGAHAELGKILLKRDDVRGAIAELERAVALDPENAAPAYSLAQAYRRTGDSARAQDLLAQVSRLNARERGDDPDGDLKRMVVRIIRNGASPSAAPP